MNTVSVCKVHQLLFKTDTLLCGFTVFEKGLKKCMVLSSYPLQPALYFKWVTLAEWIWNLQLLLQGSYNSVIT